MEKHQAIWDAKYEKEIKGEHAMAGEPWLKDWLYLVPRYGHRRALDVGCGSGYNTRFLLKHDFEVTAIDFSEQALDLCRRKAPQACVKWADLRQGLPFAGERFELIVADLSLHYFPWDMTSAIFRDVENRLVPGGLFAGRFSSTDDANYGAGTGEPVRGEVNLLVVGGIEKRFFTRDCINKLFGPPWTMVSVAEKTTCRFGSRKVLWEAVATKRNGNPAEHSVTEDGESPGDP